LSVTYPHKIEFSESIKVEGIDMNDTTKAQIARMINAAPDYSHLELKDSSVTVTLTKEEKEAILKAYDRGIEESELLDFVISKLKDQIHP